MMPQEQRQDLVPVRAGPLTAPGAILGPFDGFLNRLTARSVRTAFYALQSVANEMARAGYAPEGVKARGLPWATFLDAHYQRMINLVSDASDGDRPRYSPAYVRLCLWALRGVAREVLRQKGMGIEDYLIIREIKVPRGSTLPAGRALSWEELGRLSESCTAGGDLGARDGAILAFLYGGALRRGEAARLDLSDYDHESGRVHVAAGKGNKEGQTWLSAEARAAVARWIEIRGHDPGPLLYRFSILPPHPVAVDHPGDPRDHQGEQNQKVGCEPVSGAGIAHALKVRARKAGVAAFVSHDLRRSTITHLIAQGVALPTVQKIARHASVEATARYNREPEERAREAAYALPFPSSTPPPPGRTSAPPDAEAPPSG